MKRIAGLFALATLLIGLGAGAQQLSSALERYRKLEFPPIYDNFDLGWKERVALEFEIVNKADLPPSEPGCGTRVISSARCAPARWGSDRTALRRTPWRNWP